MMNNLKKIKKLSIQVAFLMIGVLVTNALYASYLLFFVKDIWAILGLACSACFALCLAKFMKIINCVLEDYGKTKANTEQTEWKERCGGLD